LQTKRCFYEITFDTEKRLYCVYSTPAFGGVEYKNRLYHQSEGIEQSVPFYTNIYF